MRSRHSFLVVLAVFLLAFVCWADRWSQPKTATYYSETKARRFTVIPPNLSDRMAYLALNNEDFATLSVIEKGNTNSQFHCEGRLEYRDTNGTYQLLWRRPLINRVAPVEALVSETEGVVTFDDWHKVGTSSNTVVVYSVAGRVVAQHSLQDLASPSEIQQMPHTAGSIWWKKKASLDTNKNRLVLTLNNEKTIHVDLGTGKVSR